MKKTVPPPPSKKAGTRLPPPPPKTSQPNTERQRQASQLVNNLEQEQQRPEIIKQNIKSTESHKPAQQNTTSFQEVFEEDNNIQNYQLNTVEEQPRNDFNAQDNIATQSGILGLNTQNPIAFEIKAAPIKTVPPPSNKRKGPAPPPAPPKSKIMPVKIEEPKENETAKMVESQQNLKQAFQQSSDYPKGQMQQAEEPSSKKTPEPAQEKKANPLNISKISPPNQKQTRSVPQPPKPSNKERIQYQQSQRSPTAQSKQKKISPKTSSQNLGGSFVETALTTVKQPISQIKASKLQISGAKLKKSEIKAQSAKPAQRSKLQEKLEQLRRAKEQMTQQAQSQSISTQKYDQNIDQGVIFEKEYNGFEQKQEVSYNDAVVQREEILPQKNEQQKPTQEKQLKLLLIDNESDHPSSIAIQRQQPKENQTDELRPTQAKPKFKPPSAKVKSGTPPPIKSAPKPQKKTITPPIQPLTEPKRQHIEVSASPVQQKCQTILKAQQKPEQNKSAVQPPHVKVEQAQQRKMEIAITKESQASAATEINKLLERYHSLKANYLSNIHQLQELVSFHKKQEDTQIQKINRLLSQLNKKNQQIKQICGLKSETMIEEVSSEQEQVSV